MQHLIELCKNRHSIRSFAKKTVNEAQIMDILEVIQTAPSAGNLQAYQVIIVKDETIKEKLVGAALGQRFIKDAPIVMVFLALTKESAKRYGSRGSNLYAIQDATIACTYAMLGAQAIGLSSTWVGAFHYEEIQGIMGADKTAIPVAILPIGFAGSKPYSTPRKTLQNIARFM